VASVTAALPTRVRGRQWAIVAAAAAAPLLLLLARMSPDEGAGLALRLAAAAACILVVPGALVLRALGWPESLAVALCAAVALSLAIVFAALALTFAVGGSLELTVGLVGTAALAALVPALRARAPATDRSEALALSGVVVAAVLFAGLVWWVSARLGTGDVLFHVARARKLAESDGLHSVGVANEFADGGLHPGYAFPLWHGVLALVARLAGVDVGLVALHLASALVPIAFVVAYAAGATIFRSWAGGVAVLAGQVAQLGFSRGGTGSFPSLALPSSATRIILVPALLALVFAFLREGGWRTLVPVAAAALATAVVHPTYAIFVGIVLAGFALVWVLVAEGRRSLGRLGAVFAAVAVPSGLFFLWLLPIVRETASHRPSESEVSRALAHYGDQLDRVGDAYRVSPDLITRTGPVVIAALLALPLVGLAVRRSWAALAVGGSLLVLAIVLIPDVFTRFSDLVSISQSRRLVQFLPVPFAVAGAMTVLARLRLAGVLAALGAAVALELAYPGEFTHAVERGGPTWPLWVAVIGGGLALALAATAALRRGRELVRPAVTPWAAVAAIAFVIPVAVGGFTNLERADARDRDGLAPGLVRALRALDAEDVVFAPVETSYRVAAFAPVHVAASPPPHVGDTDANRPYRRQRDAISFFAPRSGLGAGERRAILSRYGADWLLVDKRKPYPRRLVAAWPREYEDGRYLLLRVGAG
jgi:hypothetical protein